LFEIDFSTDNSQGGKAFLMRRLGMTPQPAPPTAGDFQLV